tara:strand:- start:1315 stop:1656 length:342 start_codon:yes stop_codon:yes gene_type:complete
MSNIVAEIDKKHIRAGVMGDDCNCPIALAVTEAIEADLPDDFEMKCNVFVSVGQDSIEVFYDDVTRHSPDGPEFQFSLRPVDVSDWNMINDFIQEFDKGHSVDEFCVELETCN